MCVPIEAIGSPLSLFNRAGLRAENRFVFRGPMLWRRQILIFEPAHRLECSLPTDSLAASGFGVSEGPISGPDDLIHLAVSPQFGVADKLAGGSFNAAFDLLGSPFHLILIHCSRSFDDTGEQCVERQAGSCVECRQATFAGKKPGRWGGKSKPVARITVNTYLTVLLLP
jgi:hypothetical protein